MSEHTKGPWEVGLRAMTVNAEGGRMRICDIRGWGHLTGGGAMNLPEQEAINIQAANANLIAAAPDLLEALENILYDNPGCMCANCEQGREAVKKAKGDSE